ncbi:MAG: hypothetical protein QM673_17665 [Gordonia sp. (in: high G+C Gram-positive bacteria)]
MSASFNPEHNSVSQGPRLSGPGRLRPALVDSVAIATELWIVVIIARAVALFAEYPTLRSMLDERVSQISPDVSASEIDALLSPTVLVTALVITAVVLIAVSIAVAWCARRGYNWARVVLGAMGFYIVVDTVFSLLDSIEPRWVAIPLVIAGVGAFGASVLLLRRDSDTYCREMAEFRKHGPIAPSVQYPYGPSNPYGPPLQQTGPVQPGPYQPGSYQPGPYQPGPYQPGQGGSYPSGQWAPRPPVEHEENSPSSPADPTADAADPRRRPQ